MIFHQPFQQIDLLLLQAMAYCKVFNINGAQLGVIAATAFGNIVIERGDGDQFWFGEVFINMRGDGKLGGHFRAHQASDMPNHFEGVHVDGVNMKQVVLHLANNFAEFWQVATQNAVAIHTL